MNREKVMDKTSETLSQSSAAARFSTGFRQMFCGKFDISFASGITVIFALTIVLFAIDWIFELSGMQIYLFFDKFRDFLADFFNHIRYVCDRNPYFALDSTRADRISTPLHYLLFFPFNLVIGPVLKLHDMYINETALVVAVLNLAVYEIFLFFMLGKFSGEKNKILLYLLILSGVNMSAIERGTLVIFTAGCIVGFLHYYQSSERKAQIFALILLSLAAALKVYPALFGLMLLKKKDFKGILFCIVLTSALGILPMFCFKGGLANLQQLFSNLETYRVFYKTSPGAQALSNIIGLFTYPVKPGPAVDWWLKVVDALAIGALISSFFYGKKENLCLATAAVITLCPLGAMPYTQLYLLPAFLLFMNRIQQEHSKKDVLTAAGYILLFMPFQLSEDINKTFVLTILPLMLLIPLSDGICEMKKRLKISGAVPFI